MRNKPNLPHIDPASLTTAPVSNPPDAAAAAQDALTRAAEAAARGHLRKADRETRLAERLERLARTAPPEEAEPEPDGELFRLDLERRINRYRESERARLDEMQRKDPCGWQAAFDAAVEEAVTKTRESTIAYWTDDARLFEE